jgi:hypothetical protein
MNTKKTAARESLREEEENKALQKLTTLREALETQQQKLKDQQLQLARGRKERRPRRRI